MKLYKHRIFASNILNGYDYLFTTEAKQSLVQIAQDETYEYIQSMLGSDNGEFINKCLNYITPNNVYFNLTIDDNWPYVVRLNGFYGLPNSVICEYNIRVNYQQYVEYLDHLPEFLASSPESRKISYIGVFQHGLSSYDDYKNNTKALVLDLKDSINTNVINGKQSSYSAVKYVGLAWPKDKTFTHEYDEGENLAESFVKYCNKSFRPKTKMNFWDRLKSELQSESNNDINSIYEQTSAGSYVDSLAQSVEDEMGIYAEPSIQGGIGGVWIYDNDDNVLVEDLDYETFCESIIDCALSSKTEKDCLNKLHKLYQSWIE